MLPLRSSQMKMYDLYAEDVSSYPCKMYHPIAIRCYILQKHLTYGSEGRPSGGSRKSGYSLLLRLFRLRFAKNLHQYAYLSWREYFTMRAVARLAKSLQHFSVSLHPQAEVRDGRIDGWRFREIETCQLAFGVRADSECCFVHGLKIFKCE